MTKTQHQDISIWNAAQTLRAEFEYEVASAMAEHQETYGEECFSGPSLALSVYITLDNELRDFMKQYGITDDHIVSARTLHAFNQAQRETKRTEVRKGTN